MKVDLHTHSRASDGLLSPEALRRRAGEQGVDLLALTDHDTLAGFRRLRDAPAVGPRVLSGVEWSCQWRGQELHVLGLGLSPDHPTVRLGEAHQRRLREWRGLELARRLARLGLGDWLEAARRHAAGAELTRPHFARALVEGGVVATEQQAFDRYLRRGRPAHVPLVWPELVQVLAWIRAGEGAAVLAHPLKYRLTGGRLRRLVQEFRSAGGHALEVVSGAQSADQTRHLARLARSHGLLASLGSDFHRPTPWSEPGRSGRLPEGLTPVWGLWPLDSPRHRRRGIWLEEG